MGVPMEQTARVNADVVSRVELAGASDVEITLAKGVERKPVAVVRMPIEGLRTSMVLLLGIVA